MLTDMDRENVTKATQCAELLSSDTNAIADSRNPLLAELGREALELALELEKRLKRLESIAHMRTE